MQTTMLGPLTVSRLALGAMLMGGRTPRAEGERILDRFLAAGGNLIDTADVYEDGGSERALAPWLPRRRDEVVVATKVRFEVSDPGGSGLAPERIRAACDASLRRLGTDVIDLYQVHAPDAAVPIEETLEALEGLVRAGKVRALGASNFPAWLLAWCVGLQDLEGWSPFVSLQAQYSLVERSIELVATEIARARGTTVPAVAIAWLRGVDGVTAPILGARTAEQLDDLLAAAELELTDDERDRLEAPAPPPAIYPQRMLREQIGIDAMPPLRRR
jgi:aryl-alcohol dehydrogenase-like predicted oxidoreductase